MPCNAVVTAAGRLAISPALLEGDMAAHAAALARLAPQAGITRVWRVSDGRVQLETIFGNFYIRPEGERPEGEIWGPAAGLAQVRQAVNLYLAALARQKALTAIRRLGRVTAEEALPGGAIMVSLEV